MSLDRLFEHHDITPAKPIAINDHSSNNDYWSSSAQFKEFFNNYHQQYQQQQQQRQQHNQPLDISSLLSSSPPQQIDKAQHQEQQQQQQAPFHFDNHIFEPEQDPQPVYFNPYLMNNPHPMTYRQDTYAQQPQYYSNRPRPRYEPPVLQIPTDDHYQQTRFKQTQPTPAYVACLNHGINYNGVSGPPILLPPSF